MNSPAHHARRQTVIDTAVAMNTLGINHHKAGNVSARVPDEGGERTRMFITPTGIPYEQLGVEQIVEVALADGSFASPNEPSSEWRFHRDIYLARPELNAIVHTHSVFATTLACLGREIPAFHYMVAAAGGNNIRVAPYATFGTQILSDHAIEALTGRRACLLAQHGVIACGTDLANALALALEVEKLAQMYWQCLKVATPPILSDAEMFVVLQKFECYSVPKLQN